MRTGRPWPFVFLRSRPLEPVVAEDLVFQLLTVQGLHHSQGGDKLLEPV